MPLDLHVDFARPAGPFRPLHGINKGPLAPGGLIDLTLELSAIKPPSIRLHDCHWPVPDVVDIHAVFPNFDADPIVAASYDFRLTDEYIAACRKTGAEIVYRLGESIEHTSVKRFVHPPKDYEKWAAICLGIIRHYNEGWAGGYRHNIRYWEIWNEPENKPVMWSGSEEDYFRLYKVAAGAIKKSFPELKVGGPALGYTGNFKDGAFRPGAFLTNFLTFCRRESLPLDFFSWHCYTADPTELVSRAKAIRNVLDQYGFAKTESHLNEWNYLPDNTWKPISRTSSGDQRQQFYQRMAGAEGAAFLIASLIQLQDAPVDVGNLFHGELGGFGLFSEHGVPQKNYYALKAFSSMLETPAAVNVYGSIPGHLSLAAGVATNRTAATMLISNFDSQRSNTQIAVTNLPWSGKTLVETRLINGVQNLDRVISETHEANHFALTVELPKPVVALIQLKPANGSK